MLHDLTMLEQAAAIARRELSAVELCEHYLRRIDALDASVGAYVTVDAERALARARDVPAGGPLAGVPIPVKDLNPVAGVRCTYGSALYADHVPDESDFVATRLHDAGSVMIGKTNTPEFGMPCWTESRVAPPARTPWDLTRSAAGSSGGAAAAVAAGLAPAAHGSDDGGSVRAPASACGVVGLKPGRGTIDQLTDPSALATSGAIARDVADAAALIDVFAGTRLREAAQRPPGRLRIARTITPMIAEADVDPACVAAYESASALLSELGHEVQDIAAPYTPDDAAAFVDAWAVLGGLAPVPPGREDELMALTRWHRERATRITGVGYAAALMAMQRVARGALRALAPYDAVLTPTLAQPPALVGALRDDADPERGFVLETRFTPWASAWNVTGQPAISLPLHEHDGLPIGVMLAGRPGGEATLVALAAQLEQARPWRDRHPACW